MSMCCLTQIRTCMKSEHTRISSYNAIHWERFPNYYVVYYYSVHVLLNTDKRLYEELTYKRLQHDSLGEIPELLIINLEVI
jgi:hypothetical protein